MINIAKIISGGQTGVDRAALDFAIEAGIPHGGWCPQGRRAEDGCIDDRYQLTETDSKDYSVRTEKNLLEADGTLIIDYGTPSGGTALTVELCLKHLKPVHLIDLEDIDKNLREEFWRWIEDNGIHTLNIAGSRESKHPIYERAKICLEMLFHEDSIH